MIGGSVTVAEDWPACSAPWAITVLTGGLAWRAVLPRAPTVPVMWGSKASAPQSVGVKELDFVTVVAGSPYGVASTPSWPGCRRSGCVRTARSRPRGGPAA